MNPIDRLLATEEIKALRARYCRFIDTKNWSDLQSVLAPDVILDLSATGKPLVRSRDDFIRYVTTRFADDPSLHLNYLPEIIITSEFAAEAIWGQETLILGRLAPDQPHGHCYGWSKDIYEKHNGRWHIKSVTLVHPFTI